MKRRRLFEPSDNVKSINYQSVEMCEENDDDNDNSKLKPFYFALATGTLFAIEHKNDLTKKPFCKSFSYHSFQRYLLLQVIRI